MIFLIIVSIVVVSNTIKLTVFNRAHEISIMKYIGATNWFIRGPFLAEGIIIGIISAGISMGLATLMYKKLIEVVGPQIFSVLSMPMVPVNFLAYNFTWIFMALGISIGACGSIISMRKFLDAIAEGFSGRSAIDTSSAKHEEGSIERLSLRYWHCSSVWTSGRPMAFLMCSATSVAQCGFREKNQIKRKTARAG
ncbi:MAG: FtsX-like permease family protein [Clostridia bacterium]